MPRASRIHDDQAAREKRSPQPSYPQWMDREVLSLELVARKPAECGVNLVLYPDVLAKQFLLDENRFPGQFVLRKRRPPHPVQQIYEADSKGGGAAQARPSREIRHGRHIERPVPSVVGKTGADHRMGYLFYGVHALRLPVGQTVRLLGKYRQREPLDIDVAVDCGAEDGTRHVREIRWIVGAAAEEADPQWRSAHPHMRLTR